MMWYSINFKSLQVRDRAGSNSNRFSLLDALQHGYFSDLTIQSSSGQKVTATAAAAKLTLVKQIVLKQIPQIFEYSFVLQYSNTIYAIQLFVYNHVGLHMHIFSTTWSWDVHDWWNILSY